MGTKKESYKNRQNRLMVCFFGGFVAIFFVSTVFSQPPANWTAGIAYEVIPTAKITKVSYYLGKTEGGEMLIFEVGIKNIGPKATRFKLTIYPLNGDPVSGYYPLTAKKGRPLALEPNEELISKWPVFSKDLPSGFALVVQEAGD